MDQGIGNQVADNLAEAGFVPLHDHRRRSLDDDRTRGVRRRRVQPCISEQAGEVDRFPSQGRALVETGEEQQVFDEAAHPRALLADATHHVPELAFVNRALPPEVGEPADRRDRRAQLVRSIGDEPPQLGFHCLLFVQHDIERPGQVRRLGPRHPLPDPPGAVTACDGVSDFRQLRDRLQAEPQQPPPSRSHRQHDDDARDEHRNRQPVGRRLHLVERHRHQHLGAIGQDLERRPPRARARDRAHRHKRWNPPWLVANPGKLRLASRGEALALIMRR